jgi:hypothetical protein
MGVEIEPREPPNGGTRAWMVALGAFAAQMFVITVSSFSAWKLIEFPLPGARLDLSTRLG